VKKEFLFNVSTKQANPLALLFVGLGGADILLVAGSKSQLTPIKMTS